MKTLFLLPKGDGFFTRYATLIPTLRKLGVLSQVINAITEIGIIYAEIATRYAGLIAAQKSAYAKNGK